MDENEIQIRIGFMRAIGLILENSEPSVKAGIIATLNSFGDSLNLEIEKAHYSTVASDAGVNPCTPPLIWDPILGMCV